jgi:hypothetical protein
MATTVWRPRVRIEVPNVDDAEDEVEVPEEVNKAVKRKRAPPTKGPCEHGRVRSQCKECGGASSASTVVSAI